MSVAKNVSIGLIAGLFCVAMPVDARAQHGGGGHGGGGHAGGAVSAGRPVGRPTTGPVVGRAAPRVYSPAWHAGAYHGYGHYPYYAPHVVAYGRYYPYYYGYRPGLTIGFYAGYGYPYAYPYYGYYGYPYAYYPYGYYGYGGYANTPPPQSYVSAQPGVAYGGVQIQGAPPDGQVFVDGYYVGIVDDFDGVGQHINLEAGPHRIEIRLQGQPAVSFDVNVTAGQTITYHAGLVR